MKILSLILSLIPIILPSCDVNKNINTEFFNQSFYSEGVREYVTTPLEDSLRVPELYDTLNSINLQPKLIEPLYDEIVNDFKEGKPLVIATAVALDSTHGRWINGEYVAYANPLEKNLYWGGFSFGHKEMWNKRQNWEKVFEQKYEKSPVEILVYHKRFLPNERWRNKGVEDSVDVYFVPMAYRWSGMNTAVTDILAYLKEDPFAMANDTSRNDSNGRHPFQLSLDNGVELDLREALIWAYCGHNPAMGFVIPDSLKSKIVGIPEKNKGVAIIGCETENTLSNLFVSYNIYGLAFTYNRKDGLEGVAPEGYTTIALVDGILNMDNGLELKQRMDRTYAKWQNRIGEQFFSNSATGFPKNIDLYEFLYIEPSTN